MAITGLALGAMIFALVNMDDRSYDPNMLKVSFLEEDQMAVFIFETAAREGIFEKYELRIEEVPITIGLKNTFLAGHVDAVMGPTLMAGNYLDNVDMKIIANRGYNPDYLVSKYPIEDLNLVKKVGLSEIPSNDELKIRGVWSVLGLDFESLELVKTTGGGIKMERLKRGDIDATFLLNKIMAEELVKEGFYLIDREEIFKGPFPATHILVLDEKLNKRPETYERFVLALYEAMEIFKNDREGSIGVVRSVMNIGQEEATEIYEEYSDFLRRMDYIPETGLFEALIPMIIDMLPLKPVNPERDLGELVISDFAERAVSILNIE